MKVTTAVILAAGYGSRMLPVTAGVEKVMLPILDRPIVDYVVADCVAAGITNIIFVINPNSHGLQDYYVGNTSLQGHLKRFGKTAALERLEAIHNQATFTFVEQNFDVVGYGTNPPLVVAAPHLPKNEAFIVTNGDQFSWNPNGHSDIAALITTFERTKSAGAIMVMEEAESELHRYGVADVEKRGVDEYLRGFVEKPAPGHAPSNLISLFKFVFTPQLLPYVYATKPNATGEAQLTDALLAAAREHPIAIQRAHGQWPDAGNLRGWLEANLTIAAAGVDLKDVVNRNNRESAN